MTPDGHGERVIESSAVAEQTPDGVHELVRRWTPQAPPWATVVIVHGIGEHSGRYEQVGSLLAVAGLSVVAFDLVGFGASGGSRGDIHDWVSYLDQVERHVQRALTTNQPVALFGHSMGGLIATEYALAERPPPTLLVLSAPALRGGRAWQRAAAPVLGRMVPRLSIPNAITGDQLSRDPAVGEAYFSDPLVFTKSSTRLGAQLFAAMERTRRVLTSLQVPTLVMHGGLDSLVSPTASLPFEAIGVAERRLYPALRHELFNEPEGPALVAEVIEWIKSRLGG